MNSSEISTQSPLPNSKADGAGSGGAQSAPSSDEQDGSVLPMPPFESSWAPLEDGLQERLVPLADPMTPKYMLDANLLICDWNEAFSLAFDHNIEGMRHQHILKWCYNLENYKDVISRGISDFTDRNDFPSIHVEDLRFVSERYGAFTALKRARPVLDDPLSDKPAPLLGWLITLDLHFDDRASGVRYQQDLVKELSLNYMWMEYALSYDTVLTNSDVYNELIDDMIGATSLLPAIDADCNLLDLGCGTGNLAYRLLTAGGHKGKMVLMDINGFMLNIAKAKCKPFLGKRFEDRGLFLIKQDAHSLYGLDNDEFRYVIMNNFLYNMEYAEKCLAEAHRVLQRGGEIRVSGPKKDTSLDRLFQIMRDDLTQKGLFDEIKGDFDQVQRINEQGLQPRLYRWSVQDMVDLVKDAGFSEIIAATDKAYGGEGMIVAARKN